MFSHWDTHMQALDFSVRNTDVSELKVLDVCDRFGLYKLRKGLLIFNLSK